MRKIKKNRPRFILLLLVLAFILAIPAGCLAAGEPIDQLRDAVDRIIAILRRDDPAELWVNKKEEIVAIVKSRFDADELAQRVLAQHWRSRSETEKKEFISLFSQVLETTYINKLKSYSDEEVLFTKQIVKGDRGMVYSQIVRNSQEIPIHYRLKNNKGDWRIYDIIIEGVSLVQNYRTQFDQILKQEEYAGLVRRMEEKIRENKEKDLEE
ncbi:MAG: ABC transporter substrate-binding protein [Deltaproteobacteria bacterium]|nr:ABC transporter substrate-binding protein [Deltaproteobacteria bacterium]